MVQLQFNCGLTDDSTLVISQPQLFSNSLVVWQGAREIVQKEMGTFYCTRENLKKNKRSIALYLQQLCLKWEEAMRQTFTFIEEDFTGSCPSKNFK